MYNTIKNKKGITLITLVVVIIILLILAGITINAAINKDGLIDSTKNFKNEFENIQDDTAQKLNNIIEQLNGEMSSTTPDDTTITGEITSSVVNWSGGSASITLSTTTGLTIQYKKGSSGTWTTGTIVTDLKHNDVVYARLTDGTNYSLETIINITDSTAPTAAITLSANNVKQGVTITARVTHTDNQSGVNITSCKYIYNTISSKIGTTSSSWNTATTFSQNSQLLSLTASTEGTYYLHVLTVDVAGNKTETVSQPVKVERITNVYVTLYTDGTLAFSNGTQKMAGKTVQKEYGNIKGKAFTMNSETFNPTTPWYADISSILTVNFNDRVAPESTAYWFYKCSKITEVINANNLDTSNVTNMSNMFYLCNALTSLDLSSFNTSKVTDMSEMFEFCHNITNLNIGNFNTSSVTNMRKMFSYCDKLTNLDVSKFNTSNVTDMNSMFEACKELTNLNVSNFNTSNVTNMSCMFYYCEKLTELDVSKFDTSNVTDMSNMFSGCKELARLDISKFNTSNVTDMGAMFSSCKKLTNLDVTKFVTSKVTDMRSMFSFCDKLTNLDVSKFNTSNVTMMSQMFDSCNSLTSLDLSNFNTSKVTHTQCMFRNCSNLKTIYASDKFVTTKVETSYDMFTGCTNLVGGNRTPYSSSYTGITYARIDKSGTPGYFTAKVLTGNITTNSITWSSGTATVTLGTTTGLTIQYKIGSSGTWTTGTRVTGLRHGNVVYARLTDGTSYSAETTINILDNTPPTITIIQEEVTSTSIKVRVVATDGQSGMPTNPTYQYGIKETSSQLPCIMINQGSSTTYTWSELTPNTSHNISVQTSDAAGNLKIETITITTSAPQTIYFTINGVRATGYEGQSWSEWMSSGSGCPSNLDIYAFSCSCVPNHYGTAVRYSTKQVRTSTGANVYCTDRIIANHAYSI